MIGDHYARTDVRATLLVRATDEILGTHTALRDQVPAPEPTD
jgi:hypothetical protein